MVGDENQQFVRSSSSSSGQGDAGSCSLELRERTSLLPLPPLLLLQPHQLPLRDATHQLTHAAVPLTPSWGFPPQRRSPETRVLTFTLLRCIKRITPRFIFIIIFLIQHLPLHGDYIKKGQSIVAMKY